MDILQMLESAAEEIRSLRRQVDQDRGMRANQTVRIAINQMRGGTIHYKDFPLWDALAAFVKEGRVVMDHTGEVWMDGRLLTAERFNEALKPKWPA